MEPAKFSIAGDIPGWRLGPPNTYGGYGTPWAQTPPDEWANVIGDVAYEETCDQWAVG